tara:strand:- start:398 stop:1342 length:945 start_codon:yes stop_codon:yes gene_type:complete
MGFLDNSGDIILDAVLTDHGRKLLAKGDGSFQITKFALGDEEIDYSLYNKTHASGSAYYDLEILQTPVLEAFTDNAATMKTQLQTYTNLELLFLPVLRLNETDPKFQRASNGTFYIAVNRETEDNDGSSATITGVARDSDGKERQGFMFGESLMGTVIAVDQGLDTTEISPKRTLDASLTETSYIVQIDNRLGRIVSTTGNLASYDYIDDDNIAYYTFDQGDEFVRKITEDSNSPSEVIKGPRGTKIHFRIASSMDTNTSTYLFTTLGSTESLDNRAPGGTGTSTVYYIDSNIRVTGMKTGAHIDIPVRFVRLQ